MRWLGHGAMGLLREGFTLQTVRTRPGNKQPGLSIYSMPLQFELDACKLRNLEIHKHRPVVYPLSNVYAEACKPATHASNLT
jgi:hypothetical protein